MRQRLLHLCVLACIFLTGPIAAAQETPDTKVALLVGINQYQMSRFRPSKFSERDVKELGKELKALGFDVTVLAGKNATLAEIQNRMKSLVDPLGPGDLMLVVLVGNGVQQNVWIPGSGYKNEAFFCPHDAVDGNPETQLYLKYVIEEVLAPNVGRKLLLVDACRDEPDEPRPGIRGVEGKLIALPKDTAVMFSCGKGQQSFESEELRHGLITDCILDGLRGQAVRDGKVSWSAVVEHVGQRMASREFAKYLPTGRQQEPILAGGVPDTILGAIAVLPTEKEIASRSIGMKFAVIPSGEFLMGSSVAEVQAALAADVNDSHGPLHTKRKESYVTGEQPQHRVRITTPFYMGKFEVTQEEFRKVTGRSPSTFSATGHGKDTVAGFNTDRFPVDTVSWYDAVAFCNALSTADGFTPYYKLSVIRLDPGTLSIEMGTVSIIGGNGYRLPTEAEWEYACRAGSTTPYHFGKVLSAGNANADGFKPFGTKSKGVPLVRPAAVDDAKYPPNEFGLAQMHGNVWEWCWDRFDATAYGERVPLTSDPVSYGKYDHRVCRGGSWYEDSWFARSAHRSVEQKGGFCGFRVARTP